MSTKVKNLLIAALVYVLVMVWVTWGLHPLHWFFKLFICIALAALLIMVNDLSEDKAGGTKK
jgi:hypothetical protein